jgi:hypothetical protein
MAVARVRFSPAKPGTGLLRASTGPAFRDGIPPDLSPGDTAPLMGAGVTRREAVLGLAVERHRRSYRGTGRRESDLPALVFDGIMAGSRPAGE